MNEFFPQHESAQDREDWWNYIKENHQNILFVLDGFDELSPEHQMPIDTLLKGNIFDKVYKFFFFIADFINSKRLNRQLTIIGECPCHIKVRLL